MAKGEHLSVERDPAQEEASEHRQKSRKNSSHRPISLTRIPEILNDFAADYVLGRHRDGYWRGIAIRRVADYVGARLERIC